MPRVTKIQLRRGTGAPNAADFVEGEPGWDSSGGKLYIKNSAGSMVDITGSNTFSTISVSGQSNVVADSSSDTLTFEAGSGISITTNSTTDTVTITATGSAGVDPVIAGMIW